MRHGKTLHGDIADIEFRSGAKDSPVAMMLERAATANGFGRLGVRINWNVEFSAENFQAANVVAVFVSEKNTVKLFRIHPALLEPKNDLAGAQSAIDQDSGMIGREERTVSGTAAPEHCQTEHAGI
jgi:hypothetical protein